MTLPRATQRFNLLLLGEGETYFDDFAAYFYPEESDCRRVKGRLKLCSGSIFFVPKEVKLPVQHFDFRRVQVIDTWQGALHAINPTKDDIFVLRADRVVYMKMANRNAPYEVVNGQADYRFSLEFEPLSQFLPRALRLHSLTMLEPRDQLFMIDQLLQEKERTTSFDPSWMLNFMEKPLLQTRAVRVTPLATNPGRLVLTDEVLYFQQFNNADPVPVAKVRYADFRRICERRHALRPIGLEIFFVHREDSGIEREHSLFLAFQEKGMRDEAHRLLLRQPAIAQLELGDLEDITMRWQHGLVSNYDYLIYLNFVAGRSFMDIAQYPVFPWVVRDYTSRVLDLTNPDVFRDLSRPVGALNEERLRAFRERYANIPDGQPKFLYGTHYSAPGYVVYYMVRYAPEYMLRLQNGKFDSADRLFHSIAETWYNVTHAPGDVKELIPEFYTPPGEFLCNSQVLDLGVRSKGEVIRDVVLPPWARDAGDFTTKLRDALEAPAVSRGLHHWIDLVFGALQRGEAALQADNLFYPLTYEGATEVEKVQDPTERASLEAQIQEFGQTPRQLFTAPHPPRAVAVTKGYRFHTEL
eukprot:CAMPEP_0119149810 /NCGR_PEP_ID=MMETSP1310-20130426/43880_1 /TAXON_ID=464262 /ORGANISM="Genus nov. species nov., Strain RCC2339" /LENGTH=581 /DNA_ID=CAMNT_0007141947 /DNA_START=75 /DNA_END=1817 /DNA_ORIENTATION=+